ncbi:MAG TPA: hypothetical protein VL728_07930 [Cyclobacteriaceae bacterium]|jgi:hypothetical protein|nr:hypothetical protein [Cyclobacteriaceae bacterium]
MKRTLFLLLFYVCLTITVGKQVRAFCSQLLAGKNFTTKALALDFSQSEAENEETDSEDSEESDDTDDHELTTLETLRTAARPTIAEYPTSELFKNHLKEIGTPPPRS